MAKVKDWQQFAQKLADEIGVPVTVGYEDTPGKTVADAQPKPRKTKSPS